MSLAVRLAFLNEGLFHPDEVTLARAVEGTWERGGLVGAFNGRYGAVLLNLLLYIPWHWVTGGSAERIVPFSAAVTASLLVATVYLLSRELYRSRSAALLSALFLGFNFLFLSTSTTGKENTHSLFFLAVGLHLLAAGHRKRSLAMRCASFVPCAVAVTMHEAAVPLLGVHLLYSVCLAVQRREARRAFAGEVLVGGVLLSLPVIAYLWPVIAAAATSRGSSSVPTFQGLWSDILPDALHDLVLALGWHVCALAAFGLWAARRHPYETLPLLPWLLLVTYFGNVTTYTPRYLSYLLVPVALLAGVGAHRLIESARSRVGSLLVAAVVLGSVCGYGFWKAYPLLSFRHAYSGPKRMALWAAAHSESDAVLVTMDASVFYNYYGKRRTENHPVDDGSANQIFVSTLRNMAKKGTKLYIDSTAFTYDRGGYFWTCIGNVFRFQPIGQVVGEGWNDSELEPDLFINGFWRLTPR
ncbi:MAG: glycosyltransferase family 39 protein [Deltaproteobacteria bacterium]|nr:glycosyltransferase family 39 protein [Deltaproteobacteria bacterium]